MHFKVRKGSLPTRRATGNFFKKSVEKTYFIWKAGGGRGGYQEPQPKKIYPFPGPPWLFVGLLSDRNGSISKFRRCTQDQREEQFRSQGWSASFQEGNGWNKLKRPRPIFLKRPRMCSVNDAILMGLFVRRRSNIVWLKRLIQFDRRPDWHWLASCCSYMGNTARVVTSADRATGAERLL